MRWYDRQVGVSAMRWYNRQVRKCRARHFIFTLAEIIHVAPNGPALARWWEATHGPMGALHLNRKWDAFFRGALPQRKLLKQLIDEIPELANCLTNPIWYALRDFQGGDSTAFWNSCANAVRIDDSPIGNHTRRCMDNLYAQPSLARLGVFIILLRGNARQYFLTRLCVSQDFTCYMCIALLSYPLRKVAKDIYRLIKYLIDSGRFADGIPLGWPNSLEDFLRLYDDYHLIEQRLRATVKSKYREAYVLLLLWLVVEDHKLLLQLSTQDEVVIPSSLLQRWRRWSRRFSNQSTQLLCSECDTGFLTPAERRVWSRLNLLRKLGISQDRHNGYCR